MRRARHHLRLHLDPVRLDPGQASRQFRRFFCRARCRALFGGWLDLAMQTGDRDLVVAAVIFTFSSSFSAIPCAEHSFVDDPLLLFSWGRASSIWSGPSSSRGANFRCFNAAPAALGLSKRRRSSSSTSSERDGEVGLSCRFIVDSSISHPCLRSISSASACRPARRSATSMGRQVDVADRGSGSPPFCVVGGVDAVAPHLHRRSGPRRFRPRKT